MSFENSVENLTLQMFDMFSHLTNWMHIEWLEYDFFTKRSSLVLIY